MSELEATNPVAEEPVDGLEETGVGEAHEGGEGLLSTGDNSDEETVEDETEEVEHDGQKFKLPKDIAAAIKPSLMMHADYTRKTQEIAEQRKAIDAQRAQIGGEAQEISEARATLIAEERKAAELETQLVEYRKVTPAQWANWEAQDPVAYRQARLHYEALRDARADVDRTIQTGKTALSEKTAKTLELQREAHAKQIQEGQAVLARDIKGWGPELAGKLETFGVKEFGFSRQELAGITDPRAIRVLHRAMTETQSQTTQQAATRVQAAASVKPTPKVGGASAVPPKGLDDRLSTEEWTRRRNEQTRPKRA